MSDDDWECISSDDEGEEWVIPTTFVEGYNPPPQQWSIFNQTIHISITTTILKNFSCKAYDENDNMKILTSIYKYENIQNVIATVNKIWKQASIVFDMTYNEISPNRAYEYNPDFWEQGYERIITPRQRWNVNSKINVFVVPYINHQILGTTLLWGPMGIGRQSYIYLSENHPLELITESTLNIGRCLAHEIGHVLGLEHHPNPDHLMYAEYDGTPTNFKLSNDEITYARRTAQYLQSPAMVNQPTTRSNTTPDEIDFNDLPNRKMYIDYAYDRHKK